MNRGRFIAVVGPSGVGKDSVMAGIAANVPTLHLVRRTITRAPDAGGEIYDAVTVPVFEQMAKDGAFCLQWRAHGLHYGIPMQVLEKVENGTDCIANLSRSKLAEAAQAFPNLTVLNITAAQDILARRLTARGRESRDQIDKRLLQAAKPMPKGPRMITISNDGPLNETVAQALVALQLKRT